MRNQKPESDKLGWGLIVISFIFFWPLGIFLLLYKLGIFSTFKQGYNSSKTNIRYGRYGVSDDISSRFERYKLIVEGRDSAPISYIASAVGVSYETALRELNQMLARGDFGRDAYINYLTKTLVIRSRDFKENASREPYRNADGSYQDAAAKNRGKRKTKNTESKGTVRTGVILLILAAFMGFLSAGFFEAYEPYFGLWSLLAALFSLIGAASVFGSRYLGKKRARRFAKYAAIIGERKVVDLSSISRASGVPEAKVIRDLEAMIEKGFFEKSSYVDLGLRRFIASPDAPDAYEFESEPETDHASETQYGAILREIRELNDAILDPAVSARISDIEEITGKIFKLVEEKPEKLPQIKSFMSYYLPTTLKLLRAYATFEKQGIEGENIDAAKRDIERILDMLSAGFAQQLDQLFSSDVLDISSDIDVLESMMKKDGLSGYESDFRTSCL